MRDNSDLKTYATEIRAAARYMRLGKNPGGCLLAGRLLDLILRYSIDRGLRSARFKNQAIFLNELRAGKNRISEALRELVGSQIVKRADDGRAMTLTVQLDWWHWKCQPIDPDLAGEGGMFSGKLVELVKGTNPVQRMAADYTAAIDAQPDLIAPDLTYDKAVQEVCDEEAREAIESKVPPGGTLPGSILPTTTGERSTTSTLLPPPGGSGGEVPPVGTITFNEMNDFQSMCAKAFPAWEPHRRDAYLRRLCLNHGTRKVYDALCGCLRVRQTEPVPRPWGLLAKILGEPARKG